MKDVEYLMASIGIAFALVFLFIIFANIQHRVVNYSPPIIYYIEPDLDMNKLVDDVFNT